MCNWPATSPSEDLTGKNPLLSYFKLLQNSSCGNYKAKVPWCHSSYWQISSYWPLKLTHKDPLTSSHFHASELPDFTLHNQPKKALCYRRTLVSPTGPRRPHSCVNYNHIVWHNLLTGTSYRSTASEGTHSMPIKKGEISGDLRSVLLQRSNLQKGAEITGYLIHCV